MRLTKIEKSSHVGLCTIDHECEVVELDAGEAVYIALNRILSKMVIVVPCKNEDPKTIEGVLVGIPNPCFILLVSNSTRTDGQDRYQDEVNMLKRFCAISGRKGLAVHQKDVGAAAALRDAGMPELIGEDHMVRNGKGEGMILGLALAATLCPDLKYVGFMDADSKLSGAPNEYCKAYASGFALYPEDQHVMVRIHWGSKPKERDGVYDFDVREGRSSRVVNEWLNRLLDLLWDETETDGIPSGVSHKKIVSTANAGEHAMTMGLALKLRMAGGYAIEPFHFVDLLERQVQSPTTSYCGSDDGSVSTLSSAGSLEASPVRILQIRTSNPHIHASKGDLHTRAMWKTGLGTIFHHLFPLYSSDSSIDDPLSDSVFKVRQEMMDFVAAEDKKFAQANTTTYNITADANDDVDELLPRPRVYPPLETLDLDLVKKRFTSGTAKTLHRIGFD
ncbi:hypothetical protein OQA88_5862 [Cercophora sp. LCS_1]